MYSPVTTETWYYGLLWKTVSFSAVPLFLMCTGALMLRPEKMFGIKRLFTRYIPRLLVALLGWSMFYSVYSMLDTGTLAAAGILEACKDALLFRTDNHLYYLHLALLCYLLLPLLRLVTAHASRSQLRYLLAFWLTFGSVIPCIRQFLPFVISGIPAQTLLNLAYASVGAVLAGYYFYRYPLRPLFGLLLYATGAAGTFFIVRYLALHGVSQDAFLYGMSPLVLMMAIGLFSAAQAVPLEKLPLRGKPYRILSGASFGIYLVHLWVLRLALRLAPLFSPQLLSIPLVALAVLAVSFCISRLLSLMSAFCGRLLNRIFPGKKNTKT